MKTTQHYTDISCKATSPVWKFWGGNLRCVLSRGRMGHMKRDGLVTSWNCNFQNACRTSDWLIQFREWIIDKSKWWFEQFYKKWYKKSILRYLQKQFCGKLQIHTQVWVCTMQQKYTVQFWCLFHDQSHNTIQQRCTQNLLGNYNSMQQKEFSTLLQGAEKTNFPACL